MADIRNAGTFTLGTRTVKRLGYGAMQLAGPGVFGPPKDRDGALAVLRQVAANGVNHVDTSDYYGPHITNQLIREALLPYPEDLVIVTKIGARRGDDASWKPASSAEELTRVVHDNLRNLGLDVLEVVNLRVTGATAAGGWRVRCVGAGPAQVPRPFRSCCRGRARWLRRTGRQRPQRTSPSPFARIRQRRPDRRLRFSSGALR
jgi:hypothetical protein